MRKKWIILSLIGLLLLGGVGFSASKAGPAAPGNQTVGTPGGPPWGGVWRYCRWVNPQSPACRDLMENMRGHWQKMRELRARVWQEMREWCQKNPGERFCQHRGNGQGPCPQCPWHQGP